MEYTDSQICRFNDYLTLNDIYYKYRLNKKFTFFSCLEYLGFKTPEDICEKVIRSKKKTGTLVVGADSSFSINWIVCKDKQNNKLVKLFFGKRVYVFNISKYVIEIYEAKNKTDYLVYKFNKTISTIDMYSNGKKIDDKIVSCCIDDYLNILED